MTARTITDPPIPRPIANLLGEFCSSGLGDCELFVTGPGFGLLDSVSEDFGSLLEVVSVSTSVSVCEVETTVGLWGLFVRVGGTTVGTGELTVGTGELTVGTGGDPVGGGEVGRGGAVLFCDLTEMSTDELIIYTLTC